MLQIGLNLTSWTPQITYILDARFNMPGNLLQVNGKWGFCGI